MGKFEKGNGPGARASGKGKGQGFRLEYMGTDKETGQRTGKGQGRGQWKEQDRTGSNLSDFFNSPDLSNFLNLVNFQILQSSIKISILHIVICLTVF